MPARFDPVFMCRRNGAVEVLLIKHHLYQVFSAVWKRLSKTGNYSPRPQSVLTQVVADSVLVTPVVPKFADVPQCHWLTELSHRDEDMKGESEAHDLYHLSMISECRNWQN